MQRTLKEIAGFVQAQLLGDSSVEVEGVASIQSASANDLVFAEDEGSLREAGASRAAGIIVGKFAVKTSSAKPLLICEHPRLAFARAASFLAEPERHESGVHHSAVIHPSARIAEGVSVEAYVTISEGVVIGSGTHIGPGSHIGAHATLGENCHLVGNVTIYPGVKLGNRVIVHAGAVLGSDGFGYVRDSTTGRYEKFPQIGRLEIGDDVEIGANTTVDRGALDATVIASGVKIDNLVHIAHNVSIGENVVIAAQTGVSGSSVIEDNVVVAGQVGIADHVRIEEGAILGAQSGIPSNKVIRGKGIVFWGTPARPIREYLKELAVLARLAKKR